MIECEAVVREHKTRVEYLSMSFSLYRTYRPRTFAEVIGQNTIVKTLLSQSRQRAFSHAYIFTGPRGVGKTTTARLLAKAINAEKVKKDGDLDITDPNVKLIEAGKAIDIIEIDAASHTGVDHVRSAIIENSHTHPSVLKHKVFIIDEVHMLSISAFNALLKILEEPPEHTTFILATTEAHKVPETILSRCQRFAFHRIRIDELVARLARIAKAEKISVDTQVLQDIAIRAEGSSRDAESILGQLFAFGQKKITQEDARLLLPRSSMAEASELIHLTLQRLRSEAFAFIEQFVDSGGDPEECLKDTITYSRLLLLQASASDSLGEYVASQISEEVRTRLLADVSETSIHDIVRLLDILLRAKGRFAYSDIPELALELAISEYLIDVDDTQSHAQPKEIKQTASPKERQTIQKDFPASKQELQRKKKNPDVSFSVLKEKWQDFTNNVRKVNRGLSMSMQVARPVDIAGTHVTLHVPYVFHQERIQMPTHKMLIEKELSDYFGKTMTIVCEVHAGSSAHQADSKKNIEPVSGDQLWDQVVDAFGEHLAPSRE